MPWYFLTIAAAVVAYRTLVAWAVSGSFALLHAITLLALVGLIVLLIRIASAKPGSTPLNGAHCQTWFYQSLLALTLTCFVLAVVGRGVPGRLLFVALESSALLGLLVGCWWRPATKVVRRFASVLTVCGVVVLAAEATCQIASRAIAHPLLLPPNPTPEQRLRAWRLKPGMPWMGVRVNSRGYLGNEVEVPKPRDVRRIVVIADSFGIGFVPYPKNFASLVEQQLNDEANDGRRYEVVNLSAPAIGPAEYEWLLENEALALEPDLVVCCLFAGNDFLDSRPVPAGLFDADRYGTLRLARRTKAWFRGWHATGGTTRSDAEYLDLERARLVVCMLSQRRRLYEGPLETLSRMAKRVPGRLLVFLIPDEFQVNDALYARLFEAGMPQDRFDRELPNHIVRDHCQANQIPLTDPLAALRVAEETPYLLRDTHWNETGNRIGAEILTARIWTFFNAASAMRDEG